MIAVFRIDRLPDEHAPGEVTGWIIGTEADVQAGLFLEIQEP
jgi:hypothetical protein